MSHHATGANAEFVELRLRYQYHQPQIESLAPKSTLGREPKSWATCTNRMNKHAAQMLQWCFESAETRNIRLGNM